MFVESAVVRHLRHRLLMHSRRRACLGLCLIGLLLCLPPAVILAWGVGRLSGQPWPMLLALALAVPVLLLPALAWLIYDLLALVDHQRVRLDDLSQQDELTWVLNRRHFFERAEREVLMARRHGSPLALLLIDIDRFSQINERHGRAAGDLVLRAVAEQCHRPLRQYDLCGRHGGEEFAIMLPGTGLSGALVVAERLRRTLPERPISLPDGGVASVQVSIGLAMLEPACVSLPQLLSRADEALHRAKCEGRDRVVCAPPLSPSSTPAPAPALSRTA